MHMHRLDVTVSEFGCEGMLICMLIIQQLVLKAFALVE